MRSNISVSHQTLQISVLWKPWQICFFRKLNNPTLLQDRICPLSHIIAYSVLLEKKNPTCYTCKEHTPIEIYHTEVGELPCTDHKRQAWSEVCHNLTLC